MAATHGRLTGRPGVCLSTLGPGTLSLVSFTPANVEQVYFPRAEVVGDLRPSLELLADRLECRLHRLGAPKGHA